MALAAEAARGAPGDPLALRRIDEAIPAFDGAERGSGRAPALQAPRAGLSRSAMRGCEWRWPR